MAWGRAERLVALERHEFQPTNAAGRSSGRSFFMRAAVLVATLALFTLGSAAYFALPDVQTYSTPVGGHEAVTLADGSVVELNTDTVFRADLGLTHRSAWLEKGEAYFSIEHDANRPFVVTAGHHKITVLGTKFSVRKDSEKLEVALVDGRVWFSEDDGRPARSALMTPGDVLVATADGISVTRETRKKIGDELAWRSGVIVFRNTPLAEAAKQYNRYNREKIVIGDSFAAAHQITGALPADNTQEFAHIAQKFFGLHVKRNGDEIVISR
jgi:transmembrane sensor